MKISKKTLRKLLIQSLENRYAMDAAGFEAETVDCDLPLPETSVEDVSFFAFAPEAGEARMMSFSAFSEEEFVESPAAETDVATAYSVVTLDGEEVVEYYTIDASEPKEAVDFVVYKTDVSEVAEETDGIDKSFYRTVTVSNVSEEGTEAIFETTSFEEVPEVVICYFDENTGELIQLPEVEEVEKEEVAVEDLGEIEVVNLTAEEGFTDCVVLNNGPFASSEDPDVMTVTSTGYEVVEVVNELEEQSTDPSNLSVTGWYRWDERDLNEDGKVSALDAIMMFNFFNSYFQSFFSSEVSVAENLGFVVDQMDINGDSRFSPIDILVVINDLNESSAGSTLMNSDVTGLDNGLMNPPADEGTAAARIADAWLTLGITTSVTSHLKDASWELTIDEAGSVTASDGETEIVADVSKDGVVSINGVATEWVVTLIDNVPSFTFASDVDETDDQYAADFIDAALLELY
jgi:hypothetical protein